MPPRPVRLSEQTPRSNDPFVPSGPDLVFGGNAMAPPHNVVERGVVVSSDSQRQVYRVHLNSGRTMYMPRLRAHPGDMAMLPNGTFVVVTFALGSPYIMGVLPPESISTYDENPTAITDVDGYGGSDPVLNQSTGFSSRGTNEPQDLSPGDHAIVSRDGASVGVLHGKVAQLRGSPLAQVQAFGDTDHLQLVGGTMRTVTWMGESQVVNNEGKTSFIWRGGTDQLTQTGQDEERYTLLLDIGHTGNMVNFEVNNREGQSMFKVHVDPQGKLELFSSGGLNSFFGSNVSQVHPVSINGTVEARITGNSNSTVGGDVREVHNGSRTESISSNHSHTVGQDLTLNVSRHHRSSIGGNDTEIVAGKKTINSIEGYEAKVLQPGGVHAVKTTAGNSTVDTLGGSHIVNTLGGAIQLLAGIGLLNVAAGTVTITSSGALTIAAPPGQISIGEGAVSGVSKWEELNAAIQALVAQVNAMRVLLASHAHNGLVAPDLTLTPLNAPIAVDLSSARSSVRIG